MLSRSMGRTHSRSYHYPLFLPFIALFWCSAPLANFLLPLCKSQIPFNYKGPVVTIKGHEEGYDAENLSQSKPKEVNGTVHPNVRAHTQCTFKDDKKLSDCPAVIIAGFNWWDLRDSRQDYIPIVFYGKTVPHSTQHLSARSIAACEHPHDIRTPPEPPYVSAHFFPFSFSNLLST